MPPDFAWHAVGLEWSREALHARADVRTEAMYASGLVDETRGLLERHHADLPAMRTIGYAQAARVVSGEWDLPTAIERTKIVDSPESSPALAQNAKSLAAKALPTVEPPRGSRRCGGRGRSKLPLAHPDSLAREADLIARSYAALHRAARSEAATMLNLHACEFPDGSLARERETLRWQLRPAMAQ